MIPLLLAASALAAPLSGQVLERGSGDALAGAEVAVGGTSTTTDERGRFSLEVGEGPVEISVLSPDHEPLRLTVAPGPEELRLFLVVVEAPLEIVVESFKPTAHPTRHVMDAEQIWETPGNHEDAVRLVQSMPGVTVRREYAPGAGDLSVRGSSAGDNRYYLDGIELPSLYHYDQYASVFPASQLESVELFSSTFGAAYGDSVGAVVEAVSRSEPPPSLHGELTITSIMAGGYVQAPVGERWWLTLSGRRSFLDAVESSDQYTLWPVFHDWALRADRGDASKSTSVFVWGAGDRWDRAAGELDVLDPVEASTTPSLSFQRGFEVAGAMHRWRGDTQGRLVGALVYEHLRAELSTGAGENLRRVYLATRLDAQGPLGEKLRWHAGWELIPEHTDLEVVGSSDAAAALVAVEAPQLAAGVDVDATRLRALGGVYGEVHWSVGQVRLIPGLRLGLDGLALSPEPRLALRWRAADQTELKLAAGRYAQVPDTVDALVVSDLPSTTSWQVAGGVEQTVASRLELGLDAYYKTLDGPIQHPQAASPYAADRGDAWGVELLTRYRLRERVFFSTWVAYARARVEDAEGSRPADGDQPLTLGAVLSWDPDRHWNLGLRYRLGSGLPRTPVADSVYDASSDRWLPIPGDENSERYPLYQKVDLRVARTWELRRWTLELSVEAWVVPKPSTPIYPTWSYDFREEGWVRGPVFVPVLAGLAKF